MFYLETLGPGIHMDGIRGWVEGYIKESNLLMRPLEFPDPNPAWL